MYLAFKEYLEIGGTLDNATFTRFEFKARKEIDRYTFNRLQGDTVVRESVKLLIYELIEIIDTTNGKQVTSSSNDGVSQSYVAIDFNTVVSQLVNSYLSNETTLDGTPLLYLGVE